MATATTTRFTSPPMAKNNALAHKKGRPVHAEQRVPRVETGGPRPRPAGRPRPAATSTTASSAPACRKA
eukprot:6746839-Lingulodinium_polyedra.AAC.1